MICISVLVDILKLCLCEWDYGENIISKKYLLSFGQKKKKKEDSVLKVIKHLWVNVYKFSILYFMNCHDVMFIDLKVLIDRNPRSLDGVNGKNLLWFL